MNRWHVGVLALLCFSFTLRFVAGQETPKPAPESKAAPAKPDEKTPAKEQPADKKPETKRADAKPADVKPAEKKPQAETESLKAAIKELATTEAELLVNEQQAREIAQRAVQVQQAKSELEKKRTAQMQKLPRVKLLDLADAEPTSVLTIDIASFMLSVVEEMKQDEQLRVLKLFGTVGENHAKKPEIAPFVRRLVQREIDHFRIRDLLKRVAAENKDKVALSWALWGLLQRAEDEVDAPGGEQKVEELVTRLLKEAPATETALPLERARRILFAVQKLRIGTVMPEATGQNLQGQTEKLSDFNGKVLVIDFWATWCGPCVKMIPQERALVQKYKGEPFVFLSISADDKLATVQNFLKQNSMPWRHWWTGEAGIVNDWNILSYPTIYVIDAKGTIRYRFDDVTAKDLDNVVGKLLREAAEK